VFFPFLPPSVKKFKFMKKPPSLIPFSPVNDSPPFLPPPDLFPPRERIFSGRVSIFKRP
jgi:hypothetical protein